MGRGAGGAGRGTSVGRAGAPLTRRGYGAGEQIEGAGTFAPSQKTDTKPSIDPIRTSRSRPTILVMMGVPAAGKSSLLQKLTDSRDRWVVVDADRFKSQVPGYNPLQPELVHEESVGLAWAALRRAAQRGNDVIWDITGTNPDAPREIAKMRAAGYRVRVVYADVTRDTSLVRNAQRQRQVPQEFIDWAFDEMPAAIRRMRRLRGRFYSIGNN